MTSNNKTRVAIDIGHARGTGARGQGLEEHDVCEVIAHELASLLNVSGVEAEVIDYPNETNRQDLIQTVACANAGNYDLGVSLHADCSDNEDAHGGHACFYPSSVEGSKLASSIAEQLVRVVPGRASSCVARPDLYVLKKTKATWCLVECGFISNANDAKKMTDGRAEIIEAIWTGILNYIENK